MYLAFFPQEDDDQLTQLRGGLTPFLKAVSKGLSFELEGNSTYHDKSLFDEIMQNIPAENSAPNSSIPSTQPSNTLHLEFDKLLDLQ